MSPSLRTKYVAKVLVFCHKISCHINESVKKGDYFFAILGCGTRAHISKVNCAEAGEIDQANLAASPQHRTAVTIASFPRPEVKRWPSDTNTANPSNSWSS